MSRRAGAWLGWSLCAFSAACVAASLVLVALSFGIETPETLTGVSSLPLLAAALTFAAVGAVIVSRLPENAIGWIFCLVGATLAFGTFVNQYVDFTFFAHPGSLPLATAMTWLSTWQIVPDFGAIGLVLLLFPDGRLSSRRWWPVAWLLGAGIAAGAFGYAFRPGPLESPSPPVDNPLGIEDARGLTGALTGLGWMFMVGGTALAAVSMVLRLRRARGVERQQLKWFAFAAAVLGLFLVANFLSFDLEIGGPVEELRIPVLGAAFATIPIAAGIGILRYRLYDIDVVVNRTLVYGALTATLAGAYLGSVLLLQLLLRPLTEESDLAIAGSTLAVAALFRPARSRIQRLVDRRFYRRRYDAARTLAAFSARLREEVDLDSLSAELRGVVRETMQPAHVSLWLRDAR